MIDLTRGLTVRRRSVTILRQHLSYRMRRIALVVDEGIGHAARDLASPRSAKSALE
jgi:hypothetical protein